MGICYLSRSLIWQTKNKLSLFRALDKRGIRINIFFLISPRKHKLWVPIKYKCLIKKFLKSTHNMFSWRNKSALCGALIINLYLSMGNSAHNQLMIIVSYFPQIIGFDISCKLSICWKCQSILSGKNKKNISKCCMLTFLPAWYVLIVSMPRLITLLTEGK